MTEQQIQTEIITENNEGCSRGCLISAGLVIVFLFACTLGTMAFTQSTIGQIFNRIAGIFSREPASAEVVSTRTLVNSIQPLGQLVSISAEVAKADIGVYVDSGQLNLCGHSAQHVAQGVIEAGVDLTSVDETSVVHDVIANTYKITLPPPQITSCRIEYIRQYENQSNLGCGIDWDNIRMLAQFVATTEFAEDAISEGILTRAERETTILMQSFIGALTGGTVEIEYLTPADSSPVLPQSCQPDIPRGWTFDEETQKWVNAS